jgi:hypothetical protein
MPEWLNEQRENEIVGQVGIRNEPNQPSERLLQATTACVFGDDRRGQLGTRSYVRIPVHCNLSPRHLLRFDGL